VYFLNNGFVCRFRKYRFETNENYARELFRTFFAQTVVFSKAKLGEYDVSAGVKSSYNEALILAFRGKNRTK
jgi:hypothetical protein